MGNKIEIGLENLNKALNFEINTFSIKTVGIVAIDSSFCIQKTILCEEKNLRKNISILLPNLLSFFERNGLQQQEAPHASYFTTNESKKIVKLTIGVHVSDSIKLSPNSYYQFVGNKNSKAVKTILKGDFSHLQTAKDSLFAYTDKNKIVLKYPVEIIEKYIVSKKDTKKQSEWITEIMVSVLEKPKYKRVKRPEGDTTREPGQLPTTENIVPIKEPSTN